MEFLSCPAKAICQCFRIDTCDVGYLCERTVFEVVERQDHPFVIGQHVYLLFQLLDALFASCREGRF